MKTYNLTNRKSKEAKKALNRIITTHDYYKNSYFWTPFGNANQRRINENHFINENPDVKFIKGNDVYSVVQRLSLSAKNVYYNLTVKKNGEIKDIRSIKKLLNN